MRIISGKYKSRRVNTSGGNAGNPAGSNTSGFRPTTDRAKETLFNVLNNLIDFDSIICADLFAGSGALGFESISRGAIRCDFVENSLKQAGMIQKTAKELNCEENVNIVKADVMKFLIENEGAFYDLIFADPPYLYENFDDLTALALKLRFSVFVFEHSTDKAILYNVNDFEVIDKKIGYTNFKIFVSRE